MEFHHRFELPLAPAEAWRLVTDLDRLAPCLPGVSVRRRDDAIWDARADLRLAGFVIAAEATVRLAEADSLGLSCVYELETRDRGRSRTAPVPTRVVLRVSPAEAGACVEADAAVPQAATVVGRSGRGLVQATAQRLLADVASRLAAACRESPPLAPLGEDEAVVPVVASSQKMLADQALAAAVRTGALAGRRARARANGRRARLLAALRDRLRSLFRRTES